MCFQILLSSKSSFKTVESGNEINEYGDKYMFVVTIIHYSGTCIIQEFGSNNSSTCWISYSYFLAIHALIICHSKEKLSETKKRNFILCLYIMTICWETLLKWVCRIMALPRSASLPLFIYIRSLSFCRRTATMLLFYSSFCRRTAIKLLFYSSFCRRTVTNFFLFYSSFIICAVYLSSQTADEEK